MKAKALTVCLVIAWMTACSESPPPKDRGAEAHARQLDALQRQLDGLSAENAELKQKMASAERASAHADTQLRSASTSSAEMDPRPVTRPDNTENVTLTPSGADADKVLEPGWIIEAFPLKLQDRSYATRYKEPEPVSLGSFVGAPGRIGMLDHRVNIASNNHVMYRGKGFLAIKNRGQYAFSLMLSQTTRDFDRSDVRATTIGCDLSLLLEDGTVVRDRLSVGRGESFSASGRADLVEGLYRAEFIANCNEMAKNQERAGGKEWRESLLSTLAMELAIRRPGDAGMTPLGPQDVVYIVER